MTSASAALEQVLKTTILSVMGDFPAILLEKISKEDYKRE